MILRSSDKVSRSVMATTELLPRARVVYFETRSYLTPDLTATVNRLSTGAEIEKPGARFQTSIGDPFELKIGTELLSSPSILRARKLLICGIGLIRPGLTRTMSKT